MGESNIFNHKYYVDLKKYINCIKNVNLLDTG